MRAGDKELDLRGHEIADNARVLAEELKVNASLTKLRLGNNQIGDAGARAIAEALKDNASLRLIDLNTNQISSVGAEAICEALKVNASLTEIHLFQNRFAEIGAQAIAEALKVNASLTGLDLFNNLIRDAGAQAIAEALKVNASLATLILGGNQIGDAGAQAIAEALKASLTDLKLSQNRIGPAGAKAIAEALKVNASLTKLNLFNNQIGAAGAQAIAEALKVNASLTGLKLGSNQIGAAGAQAIAEALKVNASLTVLGLADNKIGAAGAQAMADALKVNASLTELSLRDNQIGAAGAQAILSACSYLTKLNLSSNHISHIPLAFLHNTRLTDFKCDNNPWVSPPPEVVKKGLAAIRHHLSLMEREGTVRCKTGRLMVVGVAEAGKTSLFRALESQDGKTDPIDKDDRTIGIDLARWVPDHDIVKLATKDSELDLTGLEINVCDFAGQREYAVVHQLFLTSRAVYLLVFDASKPLNLATDADPWLDSIQAKSPGARVILIATHADECSIDELAERCSGFANHIVRRLVSMQSSAKRSGSSTTDDLESSPRVHGIDLSSPPADGDFGGSVLRVSSTHGHGIRDARLAIIGELARLDAIEMWIPTSYDTVLKFILEHRLKIEQVGAADSPLVHRVYNLHVGFSSHPRYGQKNMSLDEFKAALSFWHDVGEVYVFQDQVFVDRSLFLFKLVKSIAMSAAEVEKKIKNPLLDGQFKADLRRLKDSGELTRSVLFGCLWASKTDFPEADRANFVRLLEKFDVLYPVSKDLWLVPALVPDKPVPDELLDSFNRLPNHYVRRVTIPFRPFALLQRLHTDIPRGFDIQMGVAWGLVVEKGDLGEAALYHLHDAAEVFPQHQFDSGQVGPHYLDEDDAVSVITIRASSLDMLRAVLDGVLKLLGRFKFGAQLWVPLYVPDSPRNGCGVIHLRTFQHTHRPHYSTWRAEKLPSGLMDPALGFADLEPRCAPSAPQSPSKSESGSTSIVLALPFGPNLYSIVRHQLFVTPSSRREALQVLELLRPLFGPLLQAVENLHLPNGGHLLGDPVSGQIKVDPRDITWDRVDGVVKFDLRSLPVLTQGAVKSQDIVHVQRLLAFVLLKCEWDAAFATKPLADLATDLEAGFWLEAADLLRTSFASLDELRRHPFFWTETEQRNFFFKFSGEFCTGGKLDTASVKADVDACTSQFTISGLTSWDDFGIDKGVGDLWFLLGDLSKKFTDDKQYPIALPAFLRNSRNIMQHTLSQIDDKVKNDPKNPTLISTVSGLAKTQPDLLERLLALVGNSSSALVPRWATITDVEIFRYLTCRRANLPPRFLQDKSLILLVYALFNKLLSQPNPTLQEVLRAAFKDFLS